MPCQRKKRFVLGLEMLLMVHKTYLRPGFVKSFIAEVTGQRPYRNKSSLVRFPGLGSVNVPGSWNGLEGPELAGELGYVPLLAGEGGYGELGEMGNVPPLPPPTPPPLLLLPPL